MDWHEAIKNMEGWSFGDSPEMADDIAEQTRLGINRATCSLFTGQELPKIGERSYIKDSKARPVCVIEWTAVELVPFKEVDENFAKSEGYPSLEEWRRIHRSFFGRQKENFDETDPVICQYFKVVHSF